MQLAGSSTEPRAPAFRTVNDSLCRSKYSFQRLYKALGIKRLYHTHLICVRAGKREHSDYTLHQYGVEWRRGLSDAREKHCTCPSCSPPTWPSVQRLLFRECREHSLASKVPLTFFFFISVLQPTARTTD